MAPTPSVPTALTIAGSDPSGGAGIQADLRAFSAVGVHGASAVTVITAQGSHGIRKVNPVPPDMVRAQIEVVLDELHPSACKTGALGSAAIVEIVADVLRTHPTLPLVVDPVVNPSRGRALLDDSGFAALVRELIPLAELVIPNKDEAVRMVGRIRGLDDARRACASILELGAKNVLLKGGHFTGSEAVDLFFDGREFVEFRAARLGVTPAHGLGCSLSALIVGYLARGQSVREATRLAHERLHHALANPSRVGDEMLILTDLGPEK